MDETRYTEDNAALQRRYRLTRGFLTAGLSAPATVLDLGVRNPFSEIMERDGYTVRNTGTEDLDLHPEIARAADCEAVTAFEILEHLVAPFNVLRAIEAPRLYATVPLRLWFAPAYRSAHDPWDRHFHEFEDWQFDWLLDKAGWDVVRTERWKSPSGALGLRPLLRSITPRYYAVEAHRR